MTKPMTEHPHIVGLAALLAAYPRGGAEPPVDHMCPQVDHTANLSAAEASGLDRLTRAVRRELAGTEYEHIDLAWILEAGMFQLGRLIRTEQRITLPAIGTFRRHPMTAPLDPRLPRYWVDFEADQLLLEDAL